MDIKAKRDELIQQAQKGQERYKALTAELNNCEAQLRRIEGAIWLCNDILNEGASVAAPIAEFFDADGKAIEPAAEQGV
ncbi:MAG: hypothetical protein ACYCX2_12020 [Christensenellales bacterium]